VKLLEGKKAVVTGGATGIGEAVCKRFAAEGAAVSIVDTNAEAGRATAESAGGTFFEADVADSGAVREAMTAAAAAMGGISVLFNNAGFGNLQTIEDHSEEMWDRLLAVNLGGVFHCMRAAAGYLEESGEGAIVNNASGSGARPTRGELPYSAAKAGVIALTQGAAQEYAPKVRVNAVSPGVIRTPMTEPLFHIPGALDPMYESAPLARAGTVEEVTEVVLFLASSMSGYMTGQNLVVDGGLGLPQAGIDGVLKSLLAMMKPAGA
jgi:NAD(P)-dependent dehydrogenase (short-subunit alcohol dehydrogenase family)